MQINFNDLRKKLIKDYNNLIECLNASVSTSTGICQIIQSAAEIQDKLEDLKFDIIAIGILEDPSLPDCSCVIKDSNDIKDFIINT